MLKKIIVNNNEDITYTPEAPEDFEGDVPEITLFLENVVMRAYPNEWNLDATEKGTHVSDETSVPYVTIADATPDTSTIYSDIELPDDYEDGKYCYTVDDGCTLKPDDIVPTGEEE